MSLTVSHFAVFVDVNIQTGKTVWLLSLVMSPRGWLDMAQEKQSYNVPDLPVLDALRRNELECT